jgi:hypothetical protein
MERAVPRWAFKLWLSPPDFDKLPRRAGGQPPASWRTATSGLASNAFKQSEDCLENSVVILRQEVGQPFKAESPRNPVQHFDRHFGFVVLDVIQMLE